MMEGYDHYSTSVEHYPRSADLSTGKPVFKIDIERTNQPNLFEQHSSLNDPFYFSTCDFPSTKDFNSMSEPGHELTGL